MPPHDADEFLDVWPQGGAGGPKLRKSAGRVHSSHGEDSTSCRPAGHRGAMMPVKCGRHLDEPTNSPGVDFTSVAQPFFGLLRHRSYGGLFNELRGEFKDDIRGALFLSSYFSAPAVFAALLAVLIRNMTRSAVPAWLITPPAFLLVGFFMLAWIARFFMGR